MQVYESSRQMKRSYEQAAWYALIMVLVTVYLDFRSIRDDAPGPAAPGAWRCSSSSA